MNSVIDRAKAKMLYVTKTLLPVLNSVVQPSVQQNFWGYFKEQVEEVVTNEKCQSEQETAVRLMIVVDSFIDSIHQFLDERLGETKRKNQVIFQTLNVQRDTLNDPHLSDFFYRLDEFKRNEVSRLTDEACYEYLDEFLNEFTALTQHHRQVLH